MKNPSFYIQSEFYRLLNSVLVVDGITVPVYSKEQPASESDGLYVNFASSYIVPGKSKDNFRLTVRIQIDIINQLLGDEITNQRVEECANQIMGIIIPTPSTYSLEENADFGIVGVELYDARDFDDRKETNYIVRKILIFEILTKEK